MSVNWQVYHRPDLYSGRSADEEEEVEEDGESEDAFCFFNLNNSFHKTVHFGGLGDGSSSINQVILFVSSIFTSFAFEISLTFSVFKLIFASFSKHCFCRNGSSFPSKNSSSAVNIVVGAAKLFDKNSNSPVFAFSFSLSLSCGLMQMKFASSRNSAENEIRALLVAGGASGETIFARIF
ncbi:hypothetical protein Hanom_Chr04g00339061 [Helianthus anomalus]